ncbi:MAG: peptidyl-prolyl cis-trans isomerase [Thermodesulfobacteriota bacterium]|nr:peptidyl-prolyl cis-trans isomerase [Thermodesulfobacteriota bacterium]
MRWMKRFEANIWQRLRLMASKHTSPPVFPCLHNIPTISTGTKPLILCSLILCMALFFVVGCREEAADRSALLGKSKSTVVALIGEEEITREDLEQDLKQIPEQKHQALQKKILDDLIEARVFAREARKAGLHEDPEIMESLKKTTKETLARNFVRRHVDKEAEPSEEEQRKYYDEHMDQFLVPDGVMLRQIVLKEKEQAEAVLKELKEGAPFEELARKRSIGRAWKTGGRLGWRFKGRMDPALEEVAFGLEKSELSDIIKTGEGYEIIEVLNKSDQGQRPFEEAKPHIRTGLFRDKKNALVHELYKEAGVDIDPAEDGVLAKVGDDALTEETLAPILAKASEEQQKEVRRRWVQYFIDTTVFSKEARKIRLEDDPEVAREIRRKTDRILATAFRKRFIGEKTQISDKEIADYYQSHPGQFTTPPLVRVEAILVETRQEAEEIVKELKAGAGFAALAARESLYPNAASRAGEIGWFGKGERDPALEKVAFAMEPGKISDIIKTEAGFEIIKLMAKRGGETRPFDEVKQDIEMKLMAQKLAEEKERYYKEAGVKILGL